MHSSRMRTVRNSSRLLSGGVSTPPPRSRYPLPEQTPPEHAPPPGAGAPQEQATPPGADHPGAGTSLPGDPPGSRHPQEQATAPTPRSRHPPGEDTPLPVNRITDTCKNITFATSLRTVITSSTIKIILRTINSLEINTQTQPRIQRILKALTQHRNNRNSITHSHSLVQDL